MLVYIKIFEIKNNIKWNVNIFSKMSEISKVFEFIKELES